MLPLAGRMMLRCSTDMMARGHNTDRNIVAAPGALVGGANAASIRSRRPVRVGSAAVTSAPYTGACSFLNAASSWTVGVGGGQLAGVEVADQRGNGAVRVDAGAMADALPHHPLARRIRVDDRGRGLRDA